MKSNKKLQILNKQQEQSYNSNVDPFQDEIEQGKQSQQQKPRKSKKQKRDRKNKKQKKQKKSKKNKRQKQKQKQFKEEEQNEEEQDEPDWERNSMFDDQAESGSQDQQQQYEAQIGYQQQRARYQELYNKPNAAQRLMERLRDKDQNQINAQYSKKLIAIRHEEQLLPAQNDPKIFIVPVKPKHEDEMVLCILNKARHLHNKPNAVTIVSALSLKKRYPGRIFVEAFSENDIRDSLDGFINVYLGKKLVRLEKQQYNNIFAKQVQYKIQLEVNSYVRVKKGLYQGDLAKVFKVKKSSVDVLIVPRINQKIIKMTIDKQTEKITQQKQKQEKRQQLFELFINHRNKNLKDRPAKRPLTQNDVNELKQFKGMKKVRLGNINGLIILNYREEQLEKVHGTYLPIQIIPFTNEGGKFIEQLKQDLGAYEIETQYKKGQQVQVIVGDLQKHYGTLIQIKGNIAFIKCKNKQMRGQILKQPVDFIAKKFRVGDRVKVVSGVQKGKIGTILTVEPKQVQIWTQNSHAINVNKKNIQLCFYESISNENVHNLNKDDLIKTGKNQIGIVLETTKNNIKFLDTNNTIQVVSNMDFDQKMATKFFVAKNKSNQQIKTNCIVIILSGLHEKKRCRVIHVYKQFLFLFNELFLRTGGVYVENVDNCSIVAQSGTGKTLTTTKTGNQELDVGQEIKLGQTITLKTGKLKGYKGIVKGITKQRIEVRVLSKGMTQFISRQSLLPKRRQDDQPRGKTPGRHDQSFVRMGESSPGFQGFNAPSPVND